MKMLAVLIPMLAMLVTIYLVIMGLLIFGSLPL